MTARMLKVGMENALSTAAIPFPPRRQGIPQGKSDDGKVGAEYALQYDPFLPIVRDRQLYHGQADEKCGEDGNLGIGHHGPVDVREGVNIVYIDEQHTGQADAENQFVSLFEPAFVQKVFLFQQIAKQYQ